MPRSTSLEVGCVPCGVRHEACAPVVRGHCGGCGGRKAPGAVPQPPQAEGGAAGAQLSGAGWRAGGESRGATYTLAFYIYNILLIYI